MKTPDILLLGGAIVAGSYFLGKGISQLKMPSFSLDMPDLNLGNTGNTGFDLAGTINDLIGGNYGGFSNQSTGGWISTNLGSWAHRQFLEYAMEPQYITYPGGLKVVDPAWAKWSLTYLTNPDNWKPESSGGGGFR